MKAKDGAYDRITALAARRFGVPIFGPSKYLERKKKKLELYNKYELKFIELNDNDIMNLDDYLPKKLLKFGIKVY